VFSSAGEKRTRAARLATHASIGRSAHFLGQCWLYQRLLLEENTYRQNLHRHRKEHKSGLPITRAAASALAAAQQMTIMARIHRIFLACPKSTVRLGGMLTRVLDSATSC